MPDSTERASEPGSKYRVLLELGQGGTANVFLAVARGPEGFNKLVVLKALKRNLASELELRRSFLYEARLSARLNHPNIVAVNEIVEQEGLPVLVMEYLEGQPLSEIIARAGSKLTLPLRLRIISDALSGLHYSHELTDYDGTPLRLVHRDITPHNIFVTYEGVVKILDFGIARIGPGPGDTQSGVIKGKLRYMPPEQLTGEEIDRRTDIFAVGVVLWEAAAGDRMWRDMGEATIMNRLINGEIPSPREIEPACSSGLEAICMKAMAHHKESRHHTAAELQLELECLLGEMGEQVTSHEVGKFVSELFADVRQQTRRLVDAKLREEGSLSLAGSGRSSVLPGYLAAGEYERTPQGQERRQRWITALGIGLMLTGAIGAAWWLARRKAVSGPAPSASVPLSLSAPSQPETILFRVTVFPARAAIYLDDQPLYSNPFVAQKPADRRTHTVRAEAPGHVTSTREVRFDQNVELVIALDPEPRERAIAKPRGTTRGMEPAATTPEPPKTAGESVCDPPYSMDERGVKKFKPECL